MGYEAPDTNVIAITSGTQTIASGTAQIDINIKQVGTTESLNYTCEVIDLGSIEADYNYLEEIGEITDFKVNVPVFDFVILDKLTSTTGTDSFVSLITQLTSEDLIVVKLTFNSASDYYYSTRDQCEFDYKERKVKIQAQHPLKYGVIGFGKTYDISGKEVDLYLDQDVGADPTTKEAYFARDVISEYLDVIGESTTQINYSTLYEKDFSNFPSNGDTAYLIYGLAQYNFTSVTELMKKLTLSEAAIIGNIFGYAFFMPRYIKDSNVQANLTADDFESLELDYSYKSVRRYNFFYNLADNVAYTANVAENNVTINDFGQNDVNVSYEFIGTTPATYNTAYDNGISTIAVFLSGDITDAGGNSTPYYNFAQPIEFSTEILPTWRKVFRIPESVSGDAGTYISGTILGIDKLKPYQYFSVGSGVHPLVNNKDFRPSYLKYNLLDDTIEFEAYEF